MVERTDLAAGREEHWIPGTVGHGGHVCDRERILVRQLEWAAMSDVVPDRSTTVELATNLPTGAALLRARREAVFDQEDFLRVEPGRQVTADERIRLRDVRSAERVGIGSLEQVVGHEKRSTSPVSECGLTLIGHDLLDQDTGRGFIRRRHPAHAEVR